ncbi:hypothetical protein [Magnetospirillum gryphiswaldense]|uniref:Uncharacterized protein n=1 Tax=Magnetospirillum gryphiswaldense TaxID=55518 RepID=A4U0E6_9PROT|nr:hypothetical protein [Magnetospirillum gryphiswaldense]AVM73383.1 hypothetical protein MSR1_08800 [Magnetospirillum gryphiswaldense MSR-1]AVM77286.1 hypothetical protein MSR1L_08800 [Magnetospirillum gryphiswaldense]CAM76353.1 hypothetical protein MGR_0389 [Magnetospirillum gryphiswaldense MSR-1]
MTLDKSDRLDLLRTATDARHRDAMERLDTQNQFRAQMAEANQQIALRTARIEGEYAVRLRELEHEYAPTDKALDYKYFALRHELMLEEIEEREIISAIYRVIESIVARNIKLTEERERARLEIELAEVKERHRENERQHEVLRDRLAMDRDALQSRLRNEEFTHAQTVSRIDIPLKLRELGLSNSVEAPSDADTAAWLEKLKGRGMF